jgi:hypothetical protein
MDNINIPTTKLTEKSTDVTHFESFESFKKFIQEKMTCEADPSIMQSVLFEKTGEEWRCACEYAEPQNTSMRCAEVTDYSPLDKTFTIYSAQIVYDENNKKKYRVLTPTKAWKSYGEARKAKAELDRSRLHI